MNNFSGTHMRSRRNLLDLNSFAPIHFSASTYSTDVQTKSDIMKHTLGDELLLKNLHLLSDPLKKNLADSVITCETKKTMVETKDYKNNEAVKPPTTQRTDYYPSLAGITNFFAGVFNIMGTIFQKRASSPVPQYYDCYDKEYNEGQMAPPIFWQPSNFEVQNKNEEADIPFGSTNESHTNLDVEMSADCKTAATQCEEKLKQVRLLLSSKNNQNVPKLRNKQRKPKKTFIEAGSVEEHFEEAFSEGIVSLSNETFIECCTPFNYHDELLIQSDAPRIKTDFYLEESVDIKSIPEKTEYKNTEVKQNLNTENVSNDDISVTRTKDELISSCEDKLNKLKALLQPRHSKTHEKTEPIPISTENEIETVFGNELNSSDILTSSDSHNSDHFDEVTGRFNSSSVDSEDSFQIVFTDSPQNFRRRISSDCESEDSFIVFEESPDSCYTSNDVFGEEILDNESSDSDSDSDIDDDSGCGVQCKLSPSLSRTFGDLTDDSLYSQDVVDSAPVNLPSVKPQSIEEKTGLLLDEMKRNEKKKQPPKRVSVNSYF
ncbi:unnamed protein product [Euphydryas editha]|uniref:Uncharacterized protein n=1 Tax=Euphydryas editha TaxID=104508 RepID=A0AAU9UTD6_EUPED|nr:unnamed protein product [Euphydryas editha]